MQPLSSKALHSWEPTKANHRGSFYTVKIEKEKRQEKEKLGPASSHPLHRKDMGTVIPNEQMCPHQQ